MRYSDLPVWVQEIVKQRAIEQDGEKIALVNIAENTHLKSMFSWKSTTEGGSIWVKVHSGNFKPLAEFHGIKLEPETPKQESQLKEVVNILQQNAYEIHECKRKLDYLINNIK